MHDAQQGEDRVRERGLLTVPDEAWELAVRRAEVIGPLASSLSVGVGSVDAAAALHPLDHGLTLMTGMDPDSVQVTTGCETVDALWTSRS